MLSGISGLSSCYSMYRYSGSVYGNPYIRTAQAQGTRQASAMAVVQPTASTSSRGPVQPVPPVTPVIPGAEGTGTPGIFIRKGVDPAEFAVRMRIRYEDPTPSGIPGKSETGGVSGPGSTQKAAEEGKCQTCEERKYQDGSDDMGVSFQTPTNVDPDLAASAVRGHEMEHVVRERAKATREDRKVVSQSVTYHTAICPECGKSYVSGGTTRTATKANPVEEPQQDQQSQNQTQNPNRTPFEAVA